MNKRLINIYNNFSLSTKVVIIKTSKSYYCNGKITLEKSNQIQLMANIYNKKL